MTKYRITKETLRLGLSEFKVWVRRDDGPYELLTSELNLDAAKSVIANRKKYEVVKIETVYEE